MPKWQQLSRCALTELARALALAALAEANAAVRLERGAGGNPTDLSKALTLVALWQRWEELLTALAVVAPAGASKGARRHDGEPLDRVAAVHVPAHQEGVTAGANALRLMR